MEESPQNILVIEGERPLARALELKLAHNGYEVTTANTGKQGIAELDKREYHLIITDLVMPEMNGFEVIEHIRKEKPNLPIIVLSNLGQETDMQKVHALGVEDYFIKSNTPIADIVQHVNARLGKT